MTDPQIPKRPSSNARLASDARLAWILGGSLLIGSVVIAIVVQPVTGLFVVGNLLGTVMASAALLLFALGVRRAGSVTARRPLGTTALTVLAVWALLVIVLHATLFSAELPVSTLTSFSYLDLLVQFTAALIAAIQIARAGVVPGVWKWAPTWALAAAAAPTVFGQIVSLTVTNPLPVATTVMAVERMGWIAGPVFLGVLAIVLANRTTRPQTVPVYQSGDPARIQD